MAALSKSARMYDVFMLIRVTSRAVPPRTARVAPLRVGGRGPLSSSVRRRLTLRIEVLFVVGAGSRVCGELAVSFRRLAKQ